MALQAVRFCACVLLTDAISQRHQSSDAIREARSVLSLPKSCRHCLNTKHITLGSLLTPWMIQPRNRRTIFTVCLDTPCLQRKYPPSTAMGLTKTQLKLKRACKGTKMSCFYFRNRSYRRIRNTVGPLLNVVRVGVGRLRYPTSSLPQLPPARSPRPLCFEAELWRRATSSG